MSVQQMQREIDDYANEMGIKSGMSLKQLIDSHRNLRAQAIKSNKEVQAEMQKARQHATDMTVKELKEQGWFSVERLREMTLAELSEFIRID